MDPSFHIRVRGFLNRIGKYNCPDIDNDSKQNVALSPQKRVESERSGKQQTRHIFLALVGFLLYNYSNKNARLMRLKAIGQRRLNAECKEEGTYIDTSHYA
jgi:hypothetical protein